ncbi:MAG: DMT family transporter, partial [Pseudomonadota bacterium]
MRAQMRGAALMLGAATVFAAQDGVSKHLAELYPPAMIVMIRYWVFAAFVVTLSTRRPGGVRAAAQSQSPVLQITRGVLLAGQIMLVIWVFAELGLAATHAIVAVYPLMIAALGAFVLGERLDRGRWAAIGVGFLGVLIILRPGVQAIDPWALVALACAAMFAVYGVMTRVVGQVDGAATSFFYTGVAGAAGASLVGPFFLAPMAPADWPWMAALCASGVLGHFLLIKAYEAAEAARLQPYAYWQLALVTAIGVVIFDEPLTPWLLIGGGLIVAAGLVTAARDQRDGAAPSKLPPAGASAPGREGHGRA